MYGISKQKEKKKQNGAEWEVWVDKIMIADFNMELFSISFQYICHLNVTILKKTGHSFSLKK